MCTHTAMSTVIVGMQVPFSRKARVGVMVRVRVRVSVRVRVIGCP